MTISDMTSPYMTVTDVPAPRPPLTPAREHTHSDPYPLDVDDHELERLNRQGQALAPATHLVLESAGLLEGMRVLDLGSGAGDNAFAASRIVGPTGHVLGVDRSPAAVARAGERAAARHLRNVTFRVGDMHEPQGGPGSFDAIIGRLVLMYSPDPAAVLRKQAECLADGGVVVAVEFCVEACTSRPATPLVDWLVDVAGRAFQRAGIDLGLGPELWRLMTDAGLTPQGMVSVQPHFGPADPDGAGLLADILRSAAPLIQRTGLATADELDVDTYEDRLRAQLTRADAVLGYPTLYGAWATPSR